MGESKLISVNTVFIHIDENRGRERVTKWISKFRPRRSALINRWLFHHCGCKLLQKRIMLLARCPMQCSNQLAQPRGHDDEVPRRTCGLIIRMWHSCWHKYGRPCRSLDGFVTKSERQCSLQNVPRLVVGIVDVQVVWAASAPLTKSKRLPRCADRELTFSPRLLVWNDNRFGHESIVPPQTLDAPVYRTRAMIHHRYSTECCPAVSMGFLLTSTHNSKG